MKQITLDWDDWYDTFEPIDNPYEDDTKFFETYGEEVEEVKQMMSDDPHRVWTEFDDGGIGNGFHYVNRLHYYITKHAFVGDVHITVVDMYERKEEANQSLEEFADEVGLDLHDKSERTEAEEMLADIRDTYAYLQETLAKAKDYVA